MVRVRYNLTTHHWAGIRICALVLVACGVGESVESQQPFQELFYTSECDPAMSSDAQISVLIQTRRNVVQSRVTRVVRAAEAELGGRIRVRRVWTDEKGEDDRDDISAKLELDESLNFHIAVRLCKVIAKTGVRRISLQSRGQAKGIDCRIYTSARDSDILSASKQSFVTWFYASWSVDTIVVEQQFLHRVQFWRTLTRARIPVVMLDCSAPPPPLTALWRSATDGVTVPALVVRDWRNGPLRRHVFNAHSEAEALERAIAGEGVGDRK